MSDTDEKSASSPLKPGQYIGNYRVVRQIGEGGMGLVFEAIHEEIGRRAAIKVLHAHISSNPEIARRFINEARAVTRIQHPGLVQVFDFGRLPDNSAYIIMEFLEGETLAERLSRAGGRLPEAEVSRLGRQLALALSVTHDKGIIHRDLKPENVMLVADPELPQGERAKILDFGIAKVNQGGGDKTRTNAIIGTAAYMAPEQCRGSGAITDRTDVYALGIMLFQMLTGKPPFYAEEDVEVMTMHIRATAPLVRSVNSQISMALAGLVASMLVKAATERPSMRHVADELGRMLPGAVSGTMLAYAPPPRKGRRYLRPALAVASGLVLTAGLTLGLVRMNHVSGVTPAKSVGAQQSRTAAAPDSPPAAPAAAPATTPPPPAPTPPQIRWHIATEPAGAQVIRDDNGQEMGKTPWEHRLPPGSAPLNITLKLPNYFKKKLTLDGSKDEDRRETLTPINKNTVEVLNF